MKLLWFRMYWISLLFNKVSVFLSKKKKKMGGHKIWANIMVWKFFKLLFVIVGFFLTNLPKKISLSFVAVCFKKINFIYIYIYISITHKSTTIYMKFLCFWRRRKPQDQLWINKKFKGTTKSYITWDLLLRWGFF